MHTHGLLLASSVGRACIELLHRCWCDLATGRGGIASAAVRGVNNILHVCCHPVHTLNTLVWLCTPEKETGITSVLKPITANALKPHCMQRLCSPKHGSSSNPAVTVMMDTVDIPSSSSSEEVISPALFCRPKHRAATAAVYTQQLQREKLAVLMKSSARARPNDWKQLATRLEHKNWCAHQRNKRGGRRRIGSSPNHLWQ